MTSDDPQAPPEELAGLAGSLFMASGASAQAGQGLSGSDAAGASKPPATALEKLGPSPFPKAGFPFIGFLTGLYDYVAERAKDLRQNI